MIVIDSTLSYPDYASVLDTEKYKSARALYLDAIANDLDPKKVKEFSNDLLLVCTEVFKGLDNTKVDLGQLSDELAKVREVGRSIDGLGVVGAKFVSKFFEKVLDQSLFQDALLSRSIQAFSDSELSQFFVIIDEVFRGTEMTAEEMLELASNLSAYSAKHVHSSAKVSGTSNLNYGVYGISGGMVGANSYTGASGGALGKAPVLIYAFSYRLMAQGKLISVYDFLKEVDVTKYGMSSESLLAKVNQILLSNEQSSNAVLDSTYKLKLLQVTPDHGQSFEKLAVIPSNAQLELIAAIANSHYETVQRMNEEVHAKNTEGMSDKEKKAYEKAKPRNQYGWKFKNVGTVASNAQNVSVLYQKLFSRGVPRFINIPFIRNTEVGNNKLHVIDQWFASRKLIAKDQESIKVKFGTVSNLAPLLPNRAQASSSRGAINSAAYVLHEHLKYHLKSLRRSKEYVQVNLHQLDSDLGLIKLILGESLTQEEALALSEVIVNKVSDCPETVRPELIEALKGYLV